MWSGVIGISETLTVFDGEDAVGDALDMSDSERVALADYMIVLWTRFREERTQTAPVLPVDPVVESATKLMDAWDADNCADEKYPESEAGPQLNKEATAQLHRWRSAVETVITYTEPAGFQGALEMDSLIQVGDKDDLSERVLTAERLLCSAIRAMLSVPGQEIKMTSNRSSKSTSKTRISLIRQGPGRR
jgi:hypothetical protein